MTPQSDKTEADAKIALRVKDGDADAAARLVERFGPSLMAMLLHRTGNKESASSLYQESFCVLLERLGSTGIQDPAQCGGYLHQIARNLSNDEFRDKLKRAATDTLTDTDGLHAPEPSADQLLLQTQRAQLIQELLRELPKARDRQILIRFYIDEEEKDVICKALGLSSEHFNRVLHRARVRFKTLLLKTGIYQSI